MFCTVCGHAFSDNHPISDPPGADLYNKFTSPPPASPKNSGYEAGDPGDHAFSVYDSPLPVAAKEPPKPLYEVKVTNKEFITRLVHCNDPIEINSEWHRLTAEEKRKVVMDHFMVKTGVTRGLDELDYQTILRTDRGILGKLNKNEAEDKAFLARYDNVADALPFEKGGVWLLLLAIERDLNNTVAANLWQDGGIYGLIDGNQAADLVPHEKQLIVRFSLRYQCMAVTVREASRRNPGRSKTRHELLPNGLQANDHTWDAFELVMAGGNSLGVDKVYATYGSEDKTALRRKNYTLWYEEAYPSRMMKN